MRQQFREEESTPSTVRVPTPVAASGATAGTRTVAGRTLTPIAFKPLRREGKSKSTAKNLRGGRIVAGIFAFLFLPWFPVRAPVKATKIPKGPSANALLSEMRPLLDLPADGKRLSKLTSEEWAARNRQVLPPTKGTPLPAQFTDPRELQTLEALRASVQRGQKALALLPKVLTLPYTDGGILDRRPRTTMQVNELGRLRSREGVLHAIAGEHAAAVTAYLDTVALGVHVGKAGTLITAAVGESCMGVGLKELDESIAHLTPAEAQAAATRLESLLAQRITFSRMLESQRDQTIQELWFVRLSDDLICRVPVVQAANQYLVAHYKSEMDEKIALVRHPDSHTAERLDKKYGPLDPNAFSIPQLRRWYEFSTKHTETAQTLLNQLKQRAGGR